MLYSGPEDPATMVLHEKIDGIGCIARDSITQAATDIIFFSSAGVYSLGRSREANGRQSITDLSHNIRQQFMTLAGNESAATVKAVYHEPEGLYILALTTAEVEFVFNVRVPNPDGSFKITQWEGFKSNSLVSARDRELYVGHDGNVAQYGGYNDAGIPYLMRWRSSWSNFGAELSAFLKIPKSLIMSAFVIADTDVKFVWGYDYEIATEETTIALTPSVGGSEWGIMEWGIAEWSGGVSFVPKRAHLSGHGAIMQIGLDVIIDGSPFAIQSLNLNIKLGRMN